jgi:hypothetical protein
VTLIVLTLGGVGGPLQLGLDQLDEPAELRLGAALERVETGDLVRGLLAQARGVERGTIPDGLRIGVGLAAVGVGGDTGGVLHRGRLGAGGLQLGLDLLLPIEELGGALGRLLVEHGGAGDEGLLGLVAVLLRVGARLLDDGRRVAGGDGTDLGRLLLREPQDLLRAEAEALLGGRLGRSRVGPCCPEFPLRRGGLLLGALPPGLALGQVTVHGGVLGLHPREVVVDLGAVVAAQRSGERGRGAAGGIIAGSGDEQGSLRSAGIDHRLNIVGARGPVMRRPSKNSTPIGYFSLAHSRDARSAYSSRHTFARVHSEYLSDHVG